MHIVSQMYILVIMILNFNSKNKTKTLPTPKQLNVKNTATNINLRQYCFKSSYLINNISSN